MNPPKIPDNWTAEQAMAALDLLNVCYDAIWNAYEEPVTELLLRDDQLRQTSEQQHQADIAQAPCEYELDDDIPF